VIRCVVATASGHHDEAEHNQRAADRGADANGFTEHGRRGDRAGDGLQA
jgi:hypothetical protein